MVHFVEVWLADPVSHSLTEPSVLGSYPTQVAILINAEAHHSHTNEIKKADLFFPLLSDVVSNDGKYEIWICSENHVRGQDRFLACNLPSKFDEVIFTRGIVWGCHAASLPVCHEIWTPKWYILSCSVLIWSIFLASEQCAI